MYLRERLAFPGRLLAASIISGTLAACGVSDSRSDIDLGSLDCNKGPKALSIQTDLVYRQEVRIGKEVFRGIDKNSFGIKSGDEWVLVEGETIGIHFEVVKIDKQGSSVQAHVFLDRSHENPNATRLGINLYCGKG
jgi:hypothetical protein